MNVDRIGFGLGRDPYPSKTEPTRFSVQYNTLASLSTFIYCIALRFSSRWEMVANGDGGPPEVTLETSMGPFTVEMYYHHAPRTCENFIRLARKGYYNNVKFHRIIKVNFSPFSLPSTKYTLCNFICFYWSVTSYFVVLTGFYSARRWPYRDW